MSVMNIIDEFVTKLDIFLNTNANSDCDKEWLKNKIYQVVKQQFKKINTNNKIKMSGVINKEYTCKAIIKSGVNRGLLCGCKCINSFYCKKHQNEELSVNNENEDIFNDIREDKILEQKSFSHTENKYNSSEKKSIIISKNKFGNMEYGTTGLLLKSIKEDNDCKIRNRVVARQGPNGEWNPLSENDINLCKKLRIKYEIINLNKISGEIDSKKYTSKMSLFLLDETNE